MPITADRRLIKRLLSKHGEEASRQLIELHRADTLGQSSICIPRLATFETANAMIISFCYEDGLGSHRSCFLPSIHHADFGYDKLSAPWLIDLGYTYY